MRSADPPANVGVNVFESKAPLAGNVAKVKVLDELASLLRDDSVYRVLDIGCVGPSPLAFWEPLFPRLDFHLTGIDKYGINKAQEFVEQHRWEARVRLLEGDGYRLTDVLPQETFDVVVATQVLEHVARLRAFMRQLSSVSQPGGHIFLTLDSAHYKSRFDPRYPVRLLKNIVKKLMSSLGNENHYDLPWFDHEIVSVCEREGLRVEDCRYYNIPSLKKFHNHLLPAEYKNAFMRAWFDLEEQINDVMIDEDRTKELFVGLYVHARKL